jgi:glycosyltransferase involved in cell wall biosynthesis
MRVLHVHSGNLYGGVETLLSTLWRERAACPLMETSFALCFEGRLGEELRAAGAQVHTLGAARASRPLSVRRARAALARVLKANGFDIVVCHSAWSQAMFAPVVCDARTPSVFWLHDLVTGKHWLERWARRTPPALIIADSVFTSTAAERLYTRVRAEVIYYPVSVERAQHSDAERNAIRAELDTRAGDTIIIQTSRMEEWKGHNLHLEALGLLKSVRGWTCWMVGGGQRTAETKYLEELKRRAAQLGIADRVRFTGERADVRRLLSASDIHCQPNVKPEPFGIAFVEAMLAGLPVVTTAIGGAKEVVNESCGALFEEGDVQGLAEALRALITNPERRAELGARGTVRARQLCDPASQLSRLHGLLQTVVSQEVAA